MAEISPKKDSNCNLWTNYAFTIEIKKENFCALYPFLILFEGKQQIRKTEKCAVVGKHIQTGIIFYSCRFYDRGHLLFYYTTYVSKYNNQSTSFAVRKMKQVMFP